MSGHHDAGLLHQMNEAGNSMIRALVSQCTSSIQFLDSLGQHRGQFSRNQAGLGKGNGEMKPMPSRFWHTGNDTMTYPTHGIFLDSPCISFDSSVGVSGHLFRRLPEHTRPFPQDCETSVMHRLINQAGGLWHRRCLGCRSQWSDKLGCSMPTQSTWVLVRC